MVDVNKLLENEKTKAVELQKLLDGIKERYPVIIDLLDAPEQLVYSLFKIRNTEMSEVWFLAHSLNHAFEDDGCYSIVRRVNTIATDVNTFGETVYEYAILSGDFYNTQPCVYLTPEILSEVLVKKLKAYKFMEEHEKDMGSSDVHRALFTTVSYELRNASSEYLESLWMSKRNNTLEQYPDLTLDSEVFESEILY